MEQSKGLSVKGDLISFFQKIGIFYSLNVTCGDDL